MEATHRHVPWFLRPPDRGEQRNHAVVSVAYPLYDLPDGSSGYSTDVPAAHFHAMLRRAAMHAGYSARQLDVVEYCARDVTLRMPTGCLGCPGCPGCPGCLNETSGATTHAHAHAHAHATVTRRRLSEAHPLTSGGACPPGVALLARTYRIDHMPFCAFPCDAPLHSARRTRRLELRVHARARLVFETSAPLCGFSGRVVRRVRLEVDVGGDVARDLSDLRRTVENTTHVVLLGLPRLLRRREAPSRGLPQSTRNKKHEDDEGVSPGRKGGERRSL
jgi:hypothetical protein